MKNSLIALFVRLIIIFIAACGLAICVFWYPFSISLSVMGLADSVPTFEQNIEMWTQLIFYYLVSLPCFIILFLAWLITCSMKKGAFFSGKNIKIIKLSALILFVDLMVFLIGNVVFLILGWNDFALIYFILFVIGLGLTILIMFFENYLKKSVKMQENREVLIWLNSISIYK